MENIEILETKLIEYKAALDKSIEDQNKILTDKYSVEIQTLKNEIYELKKAEATKDRGLPDSNMSKEDEKKVAYSQFYKTLEHVITTKNSEIEIKSYAMSEGNSTAGGVFVPTIVNNEIYYAFNQTGLVNALAPAPIKINKKTFEWPTDTNSGTVYTISEMEEPTESTLSSSKKSFTLLKNASIHTYSNELDADSIIPLIPYHNIKMGNKFSDKIDSITLSGSPSYPSGIQINPNTLTVSAYQGSSSSNALSTSTLTADDLQDMQTKLQAYNMNFNKNAVWISTPDVLGVVKKMKDSQGQYIFQNANFGMPTNATATNGYPIEGWVLGKPWYVTNAIGNPTTSATGAGRFFGILYGDFSQLGIVEHEQGFSIAYGTEGTVGTTKLYAQDMSAVRYILRRDQKPLDDSSWVKLVAHA